MGECVYCNNTHYILPICKKKVVFEEQKLDFYCLHWRILCTPFFSPSEFFDGSPLHAFPSPSLRCKQYIKKERKSQFLPLYILSGDEWRIPGYKDKRWWWGGCGGGGREKNVMKQKKKKGKRRLTFPSAPSTDRLMGRFHFSLMITGSLLPSAPVLSPLLDDLFEFLPANNTYFDSSIVRQLVQVCSLITFS